MIRLEKGRADSLSYMAAFVGPSGRRRSLVTRWL